MPWFDELKTPRIKTPTEAQRISRVPEGLWIKCQGCGEILQTQPLEQNLKVCPECQMHFRMGAFDRIRMLTDRRLVRKNKKKTRKKAVEQKVYESAFDPYGDDLVSLDPLKFDDSKPYPERLRAAAEKTGVSDAFVCGRAVLGAVPYHLGVFEFKFMGGSMGAVVGEKIALVFESALAERLPAVIVSASGGARMQEGILSLMQMAKTSALVQRLREEGIPYISILTDPTTGGVAASISMLGDLILAEPQALIGFAGPRVIEQTMRQSLPKGFQRSEFLLQHGFVDRIVHRAQLATELREWMLRLGHRRCRFPRGL